MTDTAKIADALEEKYSRFKELSGMARAIECAVAWDSVYDANHHRVISPVSRLWSIRKGGYVLFCWDNFFAGYLAGSRCPELALSNMIEIVNERTDRGFVPNMSCGNGQKTLDRSQPPVGSRMVWELYRQYGDEALIKEYFPAMDAWMDSMGGVSVRTALVYAGDLSPAVREEGFFDFVVGADELFADA